MMDQRTAFLVANSVRLRLVSFSVSRGVASGIISHLRSVNGVVVVVVAVVTLVSSPLVAEGR